jgi:hypothetical protein
MAAHCCTGSWRRRPRSTRPRRSIGAWLSPPFRTSPQSDAVALQRAVAFERAAARSLEIARRRLELGDINYLGLLTAQQTYQQALLNLAQARAGRYADTVALFQALGGGWWNRSDVEPERPLSIADFLQ